MNKLLLYIVGFFLTMLQAQPVEMADKFRADGKIYVVVAVILLILFAMILYLFRLDRKIKKLEDKS
jgi:hypothetical protein